MLFYYLLSTQKLIEKLISQNSSILAKLDTVITEQKNLQERISNLEKTLSKNNKENDKEFLKVRFYKLIKKYY
jgi:hypothetical protein